MKKRYFAYGLAAILVVGGIAIAAVDRLPAPQGPTGEAPELGRIGDYAIGTTESDYVFPGRGEIAATSLVTGALSTDDHRLKVRIWYPTAATRAAQPTRYQHRFAGPGQAPFDINMPGIAIAGAPPLPGKRFPLVLMSHGFGGWNTQFSKLGEVIASHGYIVASINHSDIPVTSKSGFLLSFANVLLGRAQDQRQVLAQLIANADRLQIDADKIGLLGYSMGGYGALATAGANYDSASKTITQLPSAAQKIMTTPAPDIAAKIKALIIVAPWGGQPDSRVWRAESLARITAPTLMIDGDHDDVVNFDEGVSWIFDAMRGANRHMLIFRDARHNIIGNPVPSTAATPFPVIEFMNEPVWRQERINMINQHFVTAFLDLNLKGETAKAAYLNLPTTRAGDGEWPLAFGDSVGGTVAGDAQPKYWRGFQRRWALGLDMVSAKKGAGGGSTSER